MHHCVKTHVPFPIVPACEDATRVKKRLLFDHVSVFMADIIFTLLSLLLCLQTKENEMQIPI
jgi:hypothetical protein